MLRAAVALLLVLNLAHWAWTQGVLPGIAPPVVQQEPQRLAAQVQPERIHIIQQPPREAKANGDGPSATSAGEVASAVDATDAIHAADPPTSTATAPAAEPTRCLQLSGLTDAQLAALRPRLDASALPADRWTVNTGVLPARWVVYSGRFVTPEALANRKAELRQLKVPFRDVTLPSLQPGLALGTYSTEEAAQQGLKDVGKLGVKGARVVLERPETPLHTVRLPAATTEVAEVFNGVLAAWPKGGALAGRTAQPCPD